EEGGEGRGKRQREGGERHDRRRDEEHALVAHHVAELREGGDDERREHELCTLEPVHVGVVDAERTCDVGEHGRVVALQDAARELDRCEEADNGPHPHGRLLISAMWKSRPLSRLPMETCSPTPWIDARCSADISSGTKRYTWSLIAWKRRASDACIIR